MDNDKPMQKFSLEKILTVSAINYADNIGKDISSYEWMPIIVEAIVENETDLLAQALADAVPPETEAIVEYKSYITRKAPRYQSPDVPVIRRCALAHLPYVTVAEGLALILKK